MRPKIRSARSRFVPAAIILLVISLSGDAIATAQETPGRPENAVSGGVTVEAVSETEWKIINPDGVFVGLLKSEEKKSFTFYDAEGTFIGAITESGDWFHRLYRKRDTRIRPEEAQLYTEALKAIEAIKK